MRIKPASVTTLSRALASGLGQVSGSKIKKLLEHGLIRVNGRISTRGDQQVGPNDIVEYEKGRPSDPHAPFPLVFEDDAILVSEKPAGMLSIGYQDQGELSFYKAWQEYIRDRSKGRERIHIVHRLDKEVSGLLVFAKSAEVQEKLKTDWYQGVKKYYALVEGKPRSPEGTVSNYLAEGPGERVFVSPDPEKGKLAVTHYKMLREFPSHSLLEVTLETGRKNQIRVHLAGEGCPIVGDYRYGSKDPFRRRIRLHAYYLEFSHPVTGERMRFETRVPQGFTSLKPAHEKYK